MTATNSRPLAVDLNIASASASACSRSSLRLVRSSRHVTHHALHTKSTNMAINTMVTACATMSRVDLGASRISGGSCSKGMNSHPAAWFSASGRSLSHGHSVAYSSTPGSGGVVSRAKYRAHLASKVLASFSVRALYRAYCQLLISVPPMVTGVMERKGGENGGDPRPRRCPGALTHRVSPIPIFLLTWRRDSSGVLWRFCGSKPSPGRDLATVGWLSAFSFPSGRVTGDSDPIRTAEITLATAPRTWTDPLAPPERPHARPTAASVAHDPRTGPVSDPTAPSSVRVPTPRRLLLRPSS